MNWPRTRKRAAWVAARDFEAHLMDALSLYGATATSATTEPADPGRVAELDHALAV